MTPQGLLFESDPMNVTDKFQVQVRVVVPAGIPVSKADILLNQCHSITASSSLVKFQAVLVDTVEVRQLRVACTSNLRLRPTAMAIQATRDRRCHPTRELIDFCFDRTSITNWHPDLDSNEDFLDCHR